LHGKIFYEDTLVNFYVRLLTDKRTNKRTNAE